MTIVFRGYLPEGVNNALTFFNSFYARLYGYLACSPTSIRRSAKRKARAAARSRRQRLRGPAAGQGQDKGNPLGDGRQDDE